MAEGFTLAAGGEPQLGPIFGDSGFDAWMIRSRSHNEDASYGYFLTAEEQQDIGKYGWVLSANMRFVEVSEDTRALIEFHTGTVGFRLRLSGNEEGQLIVAGTGGFTPFSLGSPFDYHEYKFIYDAASEVAALWIDGVELVTGIPGFQTTSAAVIFGAPGESITYSHWNEVALTIIPEPATVALFAGLVALLLAAGIRFRRRRFSLEQ